MAGIKQLTSRIGHSNVIFSIILGFATGALAWLLNLFVQRFVITPLFCNSPDSFAVCASGGTYGWWIAAIALMTMSLVIMVRRGIYRPLLVILAVIAVLWGVWGWLGYFAWWQAALWQGALFGLAYGVFTLMARIPMFFLSLLTMVVAIVAVRLVSLLA